MRGCHQKPVDRHKSPHSRATIVLTTNLIQDSPIGHYRRLNNTAAVFANWLPVLVGIVGITLGLTARSSGMRVRAVHKPTWQHGALELREPM